MNDAKNTEQIIRERIAGAIFSFAGYLTTLPKDQAITASECHEAGPMADAIKDWATMHSLEIDEARVEDWPQQEPDVVGDVYKVTVSERYARGQSPAKSRPVHAKRGQPTNRRLKMAETNKDRELLELAEDAGFDVSETIRTIYASSECSAELARFAALVAAKEREACALLCAANQLIDMPTGTEIAVARKCAAAIRARTE